MTGPAVVAIRQVPLFVSFDEEEAAMVAESLAHALQKSYDIIDFFSFPEEEEEW